jgi:hypothetical protein
MTGSVWDPHNCGKLDPDPHQSEKQDTDPQQSKKQVSDPDLHQSKNSGGVEAQNGAIEGRICSKWKRRSSKWTR